jgi:hypothetical protein
MNLARQTDYELLELSNRPDFLVRRGRVWHLSSRPLGQPWRGATLCEKIKRQSYDYEAMMRQVAILNACTSPSHSRLTSFSKISRRRTVPFPQALFALTSTQHT